MREIKFRAWVLSKKEMVYHSILYFSGTCEIYGENPILMQYTGLKDKDGREIYEGDVVKDSRDAFNRNSKISWANSRGGFWKEPFEVGNPMHQFGRYLDSETAITLEVIGNIYENPELLEVKK